MEFKIQVEDLQNIMSKLTHVVMPNENGITSMVFVESANDKLAFKSLNGLVDIVVEATNCEIIAGGKCLFRFRDITNYINKFVQLMGDHGTEAFHFVVSKNSGVLKTKTLFSGSKPSYRSLKFEIFSEMYPSSTVFEDAQLIVNSNILTRGINKVLHCVNPLEVRTSITGINMTIDNDKIIFAGTNGVKLAEFTLDIVADLKQASCTLKYNFVSILRNIIDDDAQVFIRFDGDKVKARFNNVYLSGGMIVNDSYPDYKPMLNMDEYNSAKFPKSDFIDSVNTALGVLDSEDNSRFTIKYEDNKLILKNDRLEAMHEFENASDASLDIDVNGTFLSSLLGNFTGEDETLEIRFKEGERYVVFKSLEDENNCTLLTLLRKR